jgi:hypothetical protein
LNDEPPIRQTCSYRPHPLSSLRRSGGLNRSCHALPPCRCPNVSEPEHHPNGTVHTGWINRHPGAASRAKTRNGSQVPGHRRIPPWRGRLCGSGLRCPCSCRQSYIGHGLYRDVCCESGALPEATIRPHEELRAGQWHCECAQHARCSPGCSGKDASGAVRLRQVESG